jgi:tetratricopeptide (TPR) repeat protein
MMVKKYFGARSRPPRPPKKSLLPVITGTLLLLTSTLAVEIIRRLWSNTPDISAIFGSLLILLITVSPLVKQGQEITDGFLGLFRWINPRDRPQVMFDASALAFILVLLIWFVILPFVSIAYNNSGVKALNNRDLNAAQTFFLKATALNPDQAIFFHNIAVAYQQIGQYVNAEEWYQKVINQDSTFAPSYEGLSRVYNQEGKPQLAEQTALAGLRVLQSPRQVKSFDGIIWKLFQPSTSPEVEKEQFDASRYGLLSNLGWADFVQGKYDLAQQAFEEAIRMEPALIPLENISQGIYREALPHYFLAKILENQGKPSEAQTQWEEASRYLKQANWSDREWLLEINSHLAAEQK